jgi:exonuclease III
LSLNARSLINKFDIFEAYIASADPDIVGVTESWATSDIQDSELMISGYDMFRCDRPTGNVGGGVLLYVRSELKPSEYVPLARFPEHIWCTIRDGKDQQLAIGVCYRSDNANIFVNGSCQELMNLLNEVGRRHMLLLGDFNFGGIDWNTGAGPRTSRVTARCSLTAWRTTF